jgi:hypothetical protein
MLDENTKMMSRYSLNLDNMMKLVGEFSIIDQKMYSIPARVFTTL